MEQACLFIRPGPIDGKRCKFRESLDIIEMAATIAIITYGLVRVRERYYGN